MWSKARRLPATSAIEPFPWLGGDGARIAPGTSSRPHERLPETELDEAALRARIDAMEQEAFAKGYAQGEREGLAAAAEQADVLITRLSGTIDDIASLRAGMLHKTERDVVRMALAIAQRVMHRELDTDPELLLAMARVAIDRLGDGIVATIHLHTDDHRALMAVRARRPDLVPSAVALQPDVTVARGGCVVRSEFGVIDLGLDTQIAELSRALLGEESAALEKSA